MRHLGEAGSPRFWLLFVSILALSPLEADKRQVSGQREHGRNQGKKLIRNTCNYVSVIISIITA